MKGSHRVPPGSQSGFTLLEVIVAVSILAISSALCLRLFSGSMNNIRRIDSSAEAMSHAENVMNEILADDRVDKPTTLAGDLDENYRWEAVIQDYSVMEDSLFAQEKARRLPVKLLSIRVDLHFKKSSQGRLYRLVSLKTVMDSQQAPGLSNQNNPFFVQQP
ncbi:MAG: type IV pilus modification PilV family protein [Acidobacteriota bacterium]